MNDEARIQQLLDELHDQNTTPEEVCSSYPELLPAVRERWQQICRVRANLDALFPSPDEPNPEKTDLPHVPGYEIEGLLGRGGVGVVYRARHLGLKRRVALKMLLAGPFAQPEEKERFQREAEAVAGLRHPNIVQVYNSGEFEGRPFFTMEYVEGGTLAQKLAKSPLSARDAAKLVATLADAVSAAHASGIIHRDLKPANVLLQEVASSQHTVASRHSADPSATGYRLLATDYSPQEVASSQHTVASRHNADPSATGYRLLATDYSPKISDFGLARRIEGDSGLTRTGAAIGTPSYMAPEQARGDRGAIGPGTDVYALGAILYECLTGRPPFRAETTTATLQQVMTDEPVPPARLNPRTPRDLETICLKCLQKQPAQRYAGAAALADDLRRFERGEPITARPAGAMERAAKWIRRRPTAAAILVASLLMLLSVTAVAAWYASDRAQRGRQINHEVNIALGQAENHLKSLRDRLDDQVQAWELLSDIDQWQRLVEQAGEEFQRAKSAAVGNAGLLTEETRSRLRAVEAAVAREEAAYGLAKELDTIAVNALASSDMRWSQQRKAVAEYERLFSRQGLDVHQPGTDWFASAIRSSQSRFALIAALDNWAMLVGVIKDPQLARLLELARAADPNPWRDRFRDPAVWADDLGALTQLAKEVDVGSQSPTVLVSLGFLLQAKGLDTTKAMFERALLDHPRDFWLLLNASFFAEPAERIGLAHAALAIRPRSAMAYTQIAWYLRERGDCPVALVAADRVIEINPNYADGYFYRALALRDMKDLSGAIAAFRRAADLDPGKAPPFWYLGELLQLQGDGAAAAHAYREAADRLGVLLRDLKDQPGAVAAYQRAVERHPGHTLVRYTLGQLFQQQGRYAEAEQAYLGAIKVQPTSVLAYDSLARLLATCPDDKARDGKRAIEYATTACERTGWKDPSCLDTLAAAYAAAGHFEEAVRYQTRAVDDPAFRDDLRPAARQRLELYRQKKPFREPALGIGH
jgi:serine/threonine protein kinase/predicted Zn-dependent protease